MFCVHLFTPHAKLTRVKVPVPSVQLGSEGKALQELNRIARAVPFPRLFQLAILFSRKSPILRFQAVQASLSLNGVEEVTTRGKFARFHQNGSLVLYNPPFLSLALSSQRQSVYLDSLRELG